MRTRQIMRTRSVRMIIVRNKAGVKFIRANCIMININVISSMCIIYGTNVIRNVRVTSHYHWYLQANEKLRKYTLDANGLSFMFSISEKYCIYNRKQNISFRSVNHESNLYL